MAIFALSTIYGVSGVAIIRISGEDALQSLDTLNVDIKKIKPKRAYLRELSNNGDVIDKALVLYFNSPHSFTGEDVVELHLHGSRAIIDEILRILSEIDNFRLAKAGEFSRRGFVNGKFDLTKIEAISDLLEAQTAKQRQQAMRIMSGELAEFYSGLRNDILKLLANMEAYIDFSEDEIPSDLLENAIKLAKNLSEKISLYLDDSNNGEIVRSGIKIAIYGAPNVGKSTLLNRLAGDELAIVSDIAGTTRDIITADLDINGYKAIIFDTAGLRESNDSLEQEGMRRAKEKIAEAEIKINMFDVSDLDEKGNITKSDGENKQEEYEIILINKIDKNSAKNSLILNHDYIGISAKDGRNMELLRQRLKKLVAERLTDDETVIIRTRHRFHLQNTIKYLNRLIDNAGNSPVEIICEELRLATIEIGSITGEIHVEELLDEIFSGFCIGK